MYLYGASGHAKVVKEIIEAQGDKVECLIDDNPQVSSLSGIPVVHSAEGLSPVIVSIGVNEIRKNVVAKMNCKFGIAVHPTAIVSPSAVIGEGTVIMAGAVINADVVIGKHCIINTGASIDHECMVGDYCHIAPHSTLCGLVRVGEGTLVGVGSCVIPSIKIGEWCTIGAGAAVVRDVKDRETVVGVPAKKIKE